jgi:hypothetical protein
VITANGNVLACIPNMQHWSIQARLNGGILGHDPRGLGDLGRIRWYTRESVFALFSAAGFSIAEAIARVPTATNQGILDAIRAMATAVGNDPEAAVRDAVPLQYLIRAVPA